MLPIVPLPWTSLLTSSAAIVVYPIACRAIAIVVVVVVVIASSSLSSSSSSLPIAIVARYLHLKIVILWEVNDSKAWDPASATDFHMSVGGPQKLHFFQSLVTKKNETPKFHVTCSFSSRKSQTIWLCNGRQLAVAGRSPDMVEPNPIHGRLLVLV